MRLGEVETLSRSIKLQSFDSTSAPVILVLDYYYCHNTVVVHSGSGILLIVVVVRPAMLRHY